MNAYQSRPIKRSRRSKADIRRIKDAAYELLAADHPMSVRQVFYRLVVAGVIEKTQNEYKNTVVRLLGEMRRDRQLPFDWIADGTRWMRKPETHSSIEEALRITAQTYRRSVWANQDAYVEVWCESASAAGVLYEATAPWDVPLMAAVGFSSITFLQSSAKVIESQGKPAFLYYFGDHDASGVHIDRKIEEDLREFAPRADFTFKRVSVTPAQIEEWQLPGSPTKKTDSRAKKFKGQAVEIEAVPPAKLREICSSCITQHIDPDAYEQMRTIEDAERDIAYKIAGIEDGEHHQSGGGL